MANKEGNIILKGNPKKMWSWVHCDDLARAYRLAGEAGEKVSGEIFNVADDSKYEFREVVEKFSKAAGLKGEIKEEAIAADDFMSMLYEGTVVVKHEKAEKKLGWKPAHNNVLDEIDIYHDSWKASQE